MDFNKVPRWMLIWGFMGFMSIAGIALRGAFADLDENKKSVARHELLIPQLVEDIKSIKQSNETFRVEYRDDQKDLNKILQKLLNKP